MVKQAVDYVGVIFSVLQRILKVLIASLVMCCKIANVRRLTMDGQYIIHRILIAYRILSDNYIHQENSSLFCNNAISCSYLLVLFIRQRNADYIYASPSSTC
jgi:hypothetical protein